MKDRKDMDLHGKAQMKKTKPIFEREVSLNIIKRGSDGWKSELVNGKWSDEQKEKWKKKKKKKLKF